VVEAKKVTLGAQGVLVQAERYSKGIRQVPMYQGMYGVPFLYSTNGEETATNARKNQAARSGRRATW
jgi:type I restriction enzyme, R subunit